MTGRARGRARGRGNDRAESTRRPGQMPLPRQLEAAVGHTRNDDSPQPPTAAMQALNVNGSGSYQGGGAIGNAWNSGARGGSQSLFAQQGARPKAGAMSNALNSGQHGPQIGAPNEGGSSGYVPVNGQNGSITNGQPGPANNGHARSSMIVNPGRSGNAVNGSPGSGNVGPGSAGGSPGFARGSPEDARGSRNEARGSLGNAIVSPEDARSSPINARGSPGVSQGNNAHGSRPAEANTQQHLVHPGPPRSAQNQIPLVANYFAVSRRPGARPLYQYALSFYPEIDNPGKRMQVLRSVESTIGDVWVYDRGFMVFLLTKLPEVSTKCYGQMVSRDTYPDGVPVEVTITFTNEVVPDSPSFGHLLNVILRRIKQAVGMRKIGNDDFFPENSIAIPQYKLELWPGFKTSVQRLQDSYLLGLDVTHKILRVETVMEFMTGLYQKFLSRGQVDRFYDEAEKKLLGQVVITRYNNKTYSVMSIDWNGRPHHEFTQRNGETITYNQYYTRQYDKVISDQDQPLLLGKPKGGSRRGQPDRIQLVPELCYLTGLTDEMRNDFNVMKELNVYMRLPPRERSRELVGFVETMTQQQDVATQLENLGIQIEDKMCSFNGGRLPAEKIAQRNREHSFDADRADWSGQMKGCPMHTTVAMKTWAIVATSRDSNMVQDFYRTLQRVAQPMDVAVGQPHIELLPNDHINSYLAALRRLIQQFSLELVVTIVPTNSKDRYDAIKKLCCIEMPVPSQVIVSRTLSKRQMLMSICTKICVQINCKMGGEPWVIKGNPPVLDDIMIVGIDVCHDNVSKGKSVGAFISSTNSTFTKYRSRVTFQQPGQELSDGLTVCMIGALKGYQENRHKLPKGVLVYRDGVGEGQMEAVREHEIRQIRQAFDQITTGEPYRPALAVVIVQKRILTRLFRPNPRSRDPTDVTNPPPGTIADTVITHPQGFDFFLVSQSGRIGTIMPTHYNIIYNTFPSKWTAAIFQRLTHRLTHLYFNWPGTVRVPAPCQYAHKLAFLVGQSLHREPSIQLADQLYFL